MFYVLKNPLCAVTAEMNIAAHAGDRTINSGLIFGVMVVRGIYLRRVGSSCVCLCVGYVLCVLSFSWRRTRTETGKKRHVFVADDSGRGKADSIIDAVDFEDLQRNKGSHVSWCCSGTIEIGAGHITSRVNVGPAKGE